MVAIIFERKNPGKRILAVLDSRADAPDTVKYLNRTMGGIWEDIMALHEFHAMEVSGEIIEL